MDSTLCKFVKDLHKKDNLSQTNLIQKSCDIKQRSKQIRKNDSQKNFNLRFHNYMGKLTKKSSFDNLKLFRVKSKTNCNNVLKLNVNSKKKLQKIDKVNQILKLQKLWKNSVIFKASLTNGKEGRKIYKNTFVQKSHSNLNKENIKKPVVLIIRH